MHAKCLCKCYMYIYIYIMQFDGVFIECFASILRCFHSKVTLHGFVHVFSLERCFQN